jgi:hypothetical protein
MKRIAPWLLALVLTLALSRWQRVSGPTYPVSGTTPLSGTPIAWQLERSYPGDGDAPVRLEAPLPEMKGQVSFRVVGTDGPFTTVEMTRQGTALAAALPHQPPAGKVEYKVMLRQGTELIWLNGGQAVTLRFRGDVPAYILVPHILCMFISFLFAARAGIAAAMGEPPRYLGWAALVLMGIGGLLLGPIVQKIAFGAYWTGWPFGPDLTDNKTAVAWFFWALAMWRGGRVWNLTAALVTFIVFAIPHSWLSGNVVR